MSHAHRHESEQHPADLFEPAGWDQRYAGDEQLESGRSAASPAPPSAP